jgi:hypothetical protein
MISLRIRAGEDRQTIAKPDSSPSPAAPASYG